ncbi:MAG: aminotransferase class V-fold PLP-dependent enzyme [Candidatus Gracilibacteria bacterium]
MFQLFNSARKEEIKGEGSFSYLHAESYYFDSACQTLRPKEVIDAEREYYEGFNACGGRVKYKWGQKVDEKVAEARKEILKLIGKSERDYAVVFTLNTTMGINMVLHQLPVHSFEGIITSDIEHNSVFLPTMTWAEKNTKKRAVIERKEDGSIDVDLLPSRKNILLVNTVSNIDGRILTNVKEVADTIHKHGGLSLFDCAQMFSFHADLLKNVDFDAAFGSGHKMYGPSIGFIVIKKSLLQSMEPYFIGGGTVEDVHENIYSLVTDPNELHSLLEPGLQNWAGIVGLLEAIRWKKKYKSEATEKLGEELFKAVESMEGVCLINKEPSTTISFYTEKIDSHQLALYLAEQNIMCRSGYFCCHYYLKNKKKYPPLLRVSLGVHSTKKDVDHFINILSLLLKHS